MNWWYVLDWNDKKTVRLVGTLGFVPLDMVGPATMAAPQTPVPADAVTVVIVNGLMTALIDPLKLSTILPGLKLF